MMSGAEELDRLIRAFHRMHHSCMRFEMEKRGLEESGNPAILFVLHRMSEGAVTQKEIADFLGLAQPTVAISVKRMEKAGLLRKQTDENDLRKNRITLTEKGKALTEEVMESERVICREIISGLSDQEIDMLRGLYVRMIDNMRRLGARHPHYTCMRKDERL